MSQTEPQHPVERFVSEYGAERTTENDRVPTPDPTIYVEPSEVVIVGDAFVGRVLSLDEGQYDEFDSWYRTAQETDDDPAEMWVAEADRRTRHHFNPEYVEMVADIFDIDDAEAVGEYARMNTYFRDGFPLLVESPEGDQQALISPYILP